MIRETFDLQNLHCPSCVAKIEKAVSALGGVKKARVAFTTGLLSVEYDPAQTGPDTIAEVTRRLGYPARSVRRQELVG